MTYQVLCAYDGSPSAEKAFDFAVTLAKNFRGQLHVLAVVQPLEPAEDVETEALMETGQERFAKDFDRLRSRASQAGVGAGFEVSVGHPAEQILYHADQWKADHIVLGHRGKNTFKRWLMGSVSQRVISYATSMVTVVR
ncbi:MAG TPA: universal stress protein [Burkholderiaceae bacterium]|nr:universal stress protein [Burkholderiaceae bacterium]